MITENLAGDAPRAFTEVTKLDRHAEAIRAAGKRVLSNIFKIGRHLIDAKVICGHGKWSAWLRNEFDWSADTAERYMQVTEMIEIRKLRNLPDLPVSSVYLLARPSTPETVRQEVFDRATSGEKIPYAEVKAAIDEARRSQTAVPKVMPSHRMARELQTLVNNFSEDEIVDQIIELFKRLGRQAQTRCALKLRKIITGDA
jgi:DUF3102 family protein